MLWHLKHVTRGNIRTSWSKWCFVYQQSWVDDQMKRCVHSSPNNQAGHSKWANIKYKKMHKDNARAKLFGRLSLEIIQAVKEKGADPSLNSKLETLILKAKSHSMPKDKIETSIKNALRNNFESRSKVLLQIRGPGKCGLLLDLLTPNVSRSKSEIKTMLKKHQATYIEDGSVAFMFDQKGVLEIESTFSQENIHDQAEELAIMIGAEHVLVEHVRQNNIQFICPPLGLTDIRKELQRLYANLKIISSDVQYLAKSFCELSENVIVEADALIDHLSEHPDVLEIYDNIIGYPSKTIKLNHVIN